MNDLALYVIDGCGYCEDVRVALRNLGLEIEERNIRQNPEHHRALLAARRRATVPVLRIGEDTWTPESRDIIRYLYERFGDGEKPPVSYRRYVMVLMWGLLLGGGVVAEPAQSVLWTLACGVAAARSFVLAVRTKVWHHWAIGTVFGFGALSISLSAAEVVDLPWWYAAFAVAAVVLGAAAVRSLRAR